MDGLWRPFGSINKFEVQLLLTCQRRIIFWRLLSFAA